MNGDQHNVITGSYPVRDAARQLDALFGHLARLYLALVLACRKAAKYGCPTKQSKASLFG